MHGNFYIVWLVPLLIVLYIITTPFGKHFDGL